MAASGAAVLTGAIINIVTALLAFLVFCFLRTWAKAVKFYDPKRYTEEIKAKPHELPCSLLGWIVPTLRYSEPDIIRHCGLDTAIYIRLLTFGTELFVYVTAWCLVVVLPTNYTADEVDTLMSEPNSSFSFTDFDKLSLSNVPAGSNRLWVHVISVYVITTITLRLLWRYSRESVLLRIMFLANSLRNGPTHSVLVTDIPGVADATVAGAKQREQEERQRKKAAAEEAKRAKQQKKKQEAVRKGTASFSQLPILGAPLVTSTSPGSPKPPTRTTADTVVSEGDVALELPAPDDNAAAPASSEGAPRVSPASALVHAPASGARAVADTDEASPGTSASGASVPATNVTASDPATAVHAAAAPASASGTDPEAGRKLCGAGNAALEQQLGLRRRRVYNYELDMPSLDPRVVAKERLDAGTTPLELVESEFKLVYGGEQVEAVQLVYDQSGLGTLVLEYKKRKQELEDFLDAVKYQESNSKPLEPPKVTLLFPDAWCKEKYGGGIFKKVDGLPFWRDRLLWLEEQILQAQEEARRLIWPSAFVSFRKRVTQSVSSTGLHQHDEQVWTVHNAPEPREVIWANLGMTSAMRSGRRMLMVVLFVLMTLFFMIPVTAIQGLIDVNKLAKTPGLSAFLNNVVVNKLLQAIVPGLVLKIFLALVPTILALMMRLAGAISEAEVDLGVVMRFYVFQVIVVFFGNTLASSFFSQAEQWVNDPTSVVSVLGTAVPQAATFFITYVFVGLAGTAISFLRIAGLVLTWLFMWLAGSPRAQRRVYEEQYTNYGVSVTGHTMSILLGIVFSCINPIVTPSVLVYFALAALVEKYNNIFVYRRHYESSGQLWVRLLNQVMTALYLFQLVMIGLLAIKKFAYTILIIPVIIPTLGFHLVTLKLFARPWRIMSLHDAAELDINDQITAAEDVDAATTDDDLYLSPVFKIHKGDLDGVLAEAEEAARKVAEDMAKRAAEAAAGGKKP